MGSETVDAPHSGGNIHDERPALGDCDVVQRGSQPDGDGDLRVRHGASSSPPLLAIARTLNFTHAAEQCNVTQPALTKGFQTLEHELGSRLIYRERQFTQLIDLGEEVLPVLERTPASGVPVEELR